MFWERPCASLVAVELVDPGLDLDLTWISLLQALAALALTRRRKHALYLDILYYSSFLGDCAYANSYTWARTDHERRRELGTRTTEGQTICGIPGSEDEDVSTVGPAR